MTDLLNHLLRSGVTPSFSFPLDVADFRGEGMKNFRRHVWPKMQTGLKQGLSTYSPGKVLTVDGVRYKVNGLYIYGAEDGVNRAQTHFSDGIDGERIRYYNRCTSERCGWVSSEMSEPLDSPDCHVCGGQGSVETGIWYRPDGFAPIIVPWDGDDDLSSRRDWNRTMLPQKVTERSSIQPAGGIEFPAPLTDEEESNLIPASFEEHSESIDENSLEKLQDVFQRIQIRSTPDDGTGAELLLINSGYNGTGYHVCELCGRTEARGDMLQGRRAEGHFRPYAPIPETRVTADHESRHKCQGTPFSPSDSNGNSHDRLFLGMTFITDMIIISIPVQAPFDTSANIVRQREINDALVTVKEALITEFQKAANLVNREIKGGVRKRSFDVGGNSVNHFEIFLYDDVSGGAGLTPSLLRGEEAWPRFIRILEATEERLGGSKCIGGEGCGKACLGCLLDFRNQREHDRLDRRQGLRLLRYILHGTVPTIESGTSEGGIEEIERLAGLLRESLRSFNDPDVEVSHPDGVLTFRRDGNEVLIRPRIPYVSVIHEPVVSEWFQQGLPPQNSIRTGQHSQISLTALEQSPSDYAEKIYRSLNLEYD